MEQIQSLGHAVCHCRYLVVWIPKCRRSVLYKELGKHLGTILRELAMQKEHIVLEGHLKLDHIHMLVSITPRYSAAQVVGCIKGKSAIQIARTFSGRRRNFTGQHFWARGDFVSTVGRDEDTIRKYIKKQEQEDRRLDQLSIFE